VKFLLIATGGGIGALLRFLLAGFVQRLTTGSLPFGTIVVNVVGCLLIGILATLFSGLAHVRDEWRFLILVGGLGGFTTFSTFGLETVYLAMEGAWMRAGANVVLSNGLGLFAVWTGYRVAVVLQGVMP